MREQLPAEFLRPRPRRVQFRTAYPDLFYGFGASAIFLVAIFVLHLAQWQIALGGGVLALWFMSMALGRMQRGLSRTLRDETERKRLSNSARGE